MPVQLYVEKGCGYYKETRLVHEFVMYVYIQTNMHDNEKVHNCTKIIREHGSVSLCRDGQKTKWRLQCKY